MTGSKKMYDSLKWCFFNGYNYLLIDNTGKPYLTDLEEGIPFYHFHDVINYFIDYGYDFLSLYEF